MEWSLITCEGGVVNGFLWTLCRTWHAEGEGSDDLAAKVGQADAVVVHVSDIKAAWADCQATRLEELWSTTVLGARPPSSRHGLDTLQRRAQDRDLMVECLGNVDPAIRYRDREWMLKANGLAGSVPIPKDDRQGRGGNLASSASSSGRTCRQLSQQ